MLSFEGISLGWGLAAGFLAALILYGLHPVQRWRFHDIPGPKPRWLIGNLASLAGKSPTHVVFSKWNKQYGPLYKVWFGAKPAIIVTDAEMGRLLILRNIQRLQIRGAPDLLTGRDADMQKLNLAGMKDKELHRDMKAAWLPMFNSASLDASCSLINRSAERLCKSLTSAAVEGRETNIWRDYGKMTMNVVGTIAFGVDLHTQDDDKTENSEAAKSLISAAQTLFTQNPFVGRQYAGLVVVFPFLLPVLKVLAYILPDPTMRKMNAARKVLYETADKLLDTARKQAIAQGKPVAPSTDIHVEAGKREAQPRKAGRAVKPGSFMHLMMNSKHSTDGRSFSDAEMIAQAFIFLLAGYETTANTLAFVTYSLSANPNKATKLIQEIEREAPAGDVTAEHLARMPYTEACIKEALRVYPPATMLGRQLADDTVIEGRTLPKNTGVMVPIYPIHHNPNIYHNAEAYVPERWIENTPEWAADKHIPGKWMPFGEGTRVCVGQRLALMEAKIALVHIFRRFSFKLSPGQVPLDVESPLLLKPKTGVFVTPILHKEE